MMRGGTSSTNHRGNTNEAPELGHNSRHLPLEEFARLQLMDRESSHRRYSDPAESSSQSKSQQPDPLGSEPNDDHRPASFEEKYAMGGLIGKGTFSVVTSAKLRRDRLRTQGRSPTFACKILDVGTPFQGVLSVQRTCLEDAMKEVKILQSLRHPGLVHMVDTFVESGRVYIVTEMCRGGDLQDLIKRDGLLPESVAREVMLGIVNAVAFMHDKGIAHRDLTLSNVLFRDASPIQTGRVVASNVVLADFGLAKVMDVDGEGRHLHSVCGTPTFLAPEMLCIAMTSTSRSATGHQAEQQQDEEKQLAKYGLKADLWSCGVILYMMLSGEEPFRANSISNLLQKIRLGIFDFDHFVWGTVSIEAIDLVSSLLRLDPDRRFDAKQALEHPWLKNTRLDMRMR